MRDVIASMDKIADQLELAGMYDLAYEMDVLANTAEAIADNKSPEILNRIEELNAATKGMLMDFNALLKKWGITGERVVNGISLMKNNPKFRSEYQSILGELGKIKNYLTSVVKPKVLSTVKEIGESTPEVKEQKRPELPARVTDIE